MVWTLCTSGNAIALAGTNANSTIVASGGTLGDWSDAAESMACAIARSNVVSNFGSLTSNGKEVFQTLTASLIAQNIIRYDQSGYFTGEVFQIMNGLENDIRRVITVIQDDNNKTYLGIT